MPSIQAAREVNVVSWSSCSHAASTAVGMALAEKKRGRTEIALAFMLDGATSHPDFTPR